VLLEAFRSLKTSLGVYWVNLSVVDLSGKLVLPTSLLLPAFQSLLPLLLTMVMEMVLLVCGAPGLGCLR
jgi:hypothetical protein